ncbi:DUF4062 domain-containing protein [Vibrio diabolicus]|uniref:DUF4062 domain-containing protein n=1 Tax=Vibrio diabolicus TaxID=50719 RepID=UPI0022A83F90|nr:DUF4062 domain-containing protein [Vibrio diabolicus]MCZ0925353.1 DUF4062 domain-containing protein [Vibrio diabolicus]
MAKLKVFVSSTYYDLKHVRSYVGDFIEKIGYEAVMSEKGRIAYTPESALDISCYRDAEACDLFVLIVGGRYGSAISNTDSVKLDKDFYTRYESVTRKEFDSAHSRDVPTYILVDKSVMSEYETFKKNRDNNTINYAHVDSVNIFLFLDEVLNKKRNNPVFHFEQAQDIEEWLKNQWSGHFKDMLEKKSQNQQLNSLSKQVKELKGVTNSLQRYLEEIIQKVAGVDAQQIIDSEHQKQLQEKLDSDLMGFGLISLLTKNYGLTLEEAKNIYVSSTSILNLIDNLCAASENLNRSNIIEKWSSTPDIIEEINEIRNFLGQNDLTNDLSL